MKRTVILLAIVTFFIGCGSNPEKNEVKTENSKKYIDAGMRYLKDSDIANAIQSFDTAIKINPQDPENYIILGQVYLRLKNYQAAIDTFTAATRIDPNNGEAFYFLATSKMLRARPGDKEKAIKDAKTSADLFLKNNNQEQLKKAIALVQGFSQVK